MADNPEVESGTGIVVATDDVAGVHFQRVKLALGAPDAYDTDVDSGQQVMASSVPVVLASDHGPVPVRGVFVIATATLTRPANVTAYAANDELTDTGGAVLTFANCARVNAGSGIITQVTCSHSTNPAIKPALELWLFHTTTTPGTDNAAFAPTDGVVDTRVCVIPLPSQHSGDVATSGNAIYQALGLNVGFVCGGATTSLFARVVTRNGWTPPANSDTLKFELGILQN